MGAILEEPDRLGACLCALERYDLRRKYVEMLMLLTTVHHHHRKHNTKRLVDFLYNES